MQLSGLDLNLLPLLHAVLEEANVARAARRVGLSASAASHALTRLRAQLDDPLLVRAGRGLVRTPRAEALLPLVRTAVDNLHRVFQAPPSIDPATIRRAFRLSAADDVRVALLGPLDARLRQVAPGVDVHGLPFAPGAFERLRAGDADLAVAVFGEVPDDLDRVPIYADQLVAVARRGHPSAGAEISAAAFAALSHVLVAPLGTPRGLVDTQLERRGLSRRVSRTVPIFLDAVALVAETDLVVTLPGRLVDAVSERYQLARLDLDLPMPEFSVSAVWHRRWEADGEHRWFRELVADVGARLARPNSAV